MPPRAKPLAREARRAALVDATVPLLLEHGRTVTTKQIADAAGVAEGTIFRVFDSKDDLLQASLEHALDLDPFIAQLEQVDPDQELGAMLLEVVGLFQQRFSRVFQLMSRMGLVGPPKAHRHLEAERERVAAILVGLAERHRGAFAVLPKPFRADAVISAIERAANHHAHGDRAAAPDRTARARGDCGRTRKLAADLSLATRRCRAPRP